MKLVIKIWFTWIALMSFVIGVSAFSGFKLNQMTGWTCGETNAVYIYDANGCRERFFVHTAAGTEAAEYAYDEDTRLIEVTIRDTEQPKVYSFGYDYRTRRISRETPTEKTLHVFDGGLTVQEYDISQASQPSVNNLTTESIRTEGYGGGVGGMVYSVRNGQLDASHSNHRGDVIARTDNRGTLSYFARYYAYGTRFHEIGATYDRQRANTKDEESGIRALNEGERWRDLDHGVMLQPDRLGYYDGPNRYVYVQNNPITHYDARGLYLESLWDAANVAMGAVSFWNNAKQGNWGSAALDLGGVVVDVAATIVPAVPGGAGATIKAKRVAKLAVDAIDTTGDALKSADKIADGVEVVAKETVKKTTKEATEKATKATLEKGAKETAEEVGEKAVTKSKTKTNAKERRKADKDRSGKQGAQEKRTPGNNQAQNKQFKDATEGLTKAQKRQVHEQITKKDMTYKEIKRIADDMKRTEK